MSVQCPLFPWPPPTSAPHPSSQGMHATVRHTVVYAPLAQPWAVDGAKPTRFVLLAPFRRTHGSMRGVGAAQSCQPPRKSIPSI